MKIDFTQFSNPIDALDLSKWNRDTDLEIDPEDAAIAGISDENLDSEYELGETKIEFRFTPDHSLVFAADSVVADIRANHSLRSLCFRSKSVSANEIVPLVTPVIEDWRLHSFEEPDDPDEASDESAEAEPEKIDAIEELERWALAPPDLLPSYLAQSDPNLSPGIWFFRVVINEHPLHESHYVASIQVFWRDSEFDRNHKDNTFWSRADAIIEHANDQASDEPVSRVAKSLLYAAARYNIFDHWTYFEDQESYADSKDEAIESCVETFRQMLETNFEDYLEQFSDGDEE